MPNDNLTGRSPAPADRVDPNVTMPPHVAAAAARSTEAFNATYGQSNGEAVAAPPDGGNSPGNGATPHPNGNGEPPAPPAPEEFPEDNADGTPNWENRFKALKGRWDSRERTTRETLDQYEQRMRGLANELQNAKKPPLPGEEEPPALVTPKELEEYGPELVDLIKRAAQEAMIPMLKPFATEIGHMKGRVETTQQETERQFLQRMHSSMDQAVPGWNELNADANFIAWTKQNDVYSGLNRQELLQRAWYAGDSNRVAAFFRGYLSELAAVDPAAFEARQRALAGQGGHAPQGPAPSTPPPAAPRVTLESLAAPGRARAGASPPAGKPVWTAAGISQFYMDVAAGKFRGRDQERIATEQDLMAAQREGRIQINPRTATHITGN